MSVPTSALCYGSAMITERFLMGRGVGVMTDEDRVLLEQSIDEIREVPARTVLIRQGEEVKQSTFLVEGHVCRYMDDRQGYRQLVGIHVPGDFFDLHGFPMRRLDHDVATLGPARLAIFNHDTLISLTSQSPGLTRMLWFSTLLDAAMHREWIFRLGRLSADGRIAHFFCELGTRLRMVGLSDGLNFRAPINQSDIAEACGITAIHVNRTLKRLREDGMLTFRAGQVIIHDLPKLRRRAEFDEAYLYPGPGRDIAGE